MDISELGGWAPAIISGLTREYPHGWRHTASGPVVLAPRDAHPAFYGCFDWHSAVHMHWALVRLLRLGLADAEAARAVLDAHLRPEAIAGELAYLTADPLFERPYGWGWALELTEEVTAWDDPDARRWASALRPLASLLTARFVSWLPAMARPVRAGMHLNSAFALSRSLRWARRLADEGDPALLDAVTDAALRWFGDDIAYDNRREPDGWDFLSPGLAEVDLMARVLPSGRFDGWLDGFLPGLAAGELGSWSAPVPGGDRSDGQVAHLDGLNLHRAHVLARLAAGRDLPDVLEASRRHAVAGLAHVTGGDYMSEHWLASFALLALGVAD